MKKFKDAISLQVGYDNLEREFTRKCQELNKIKRQLEVFTRESGSSGLGVGENLTSVNNKKGTEIDGIDTNIIESSSGDSIANCHTDNVSDDELAVKKLASGFKIDTSKIIDELSAPTFEDDNGKPNPISSVTDLAVDFLSNNNQCDNTENLAIEDIASKKCESSKDSQSGLESNNTTDIEAVTTCVDDNPLCSNSDENKTEQNALELDDEQKQLELKNGVPGECDDKESLPFESINNSAEICPTEKEKASGFSINEKFLNSNWKRSVASFVADNPNARPYFKDIAKVLIERKDIASLPDCLNVAYALALSKSKPASIININNGDRADHKNRFSNNAVFEASALGIDAKNFDGTDNQSSIVAIKKQAVDEYLSSLATRKKSSPKILGGGASVVGVTPKRKISNLSEAGNYLLNLLK